MFYTKHLQRDTTFAFLPTHSVLETTRWRPLTNCWATHSTQLNLAAKILSPRQLHAPPWQHWAQMSLNCTEPSDLKVFSLSLYTFWGQKCSKCQLCRSTAQLAWRVYLSSDLIHRISAVSLCGRSLFSVERVASPQKSNSFTLNTSPNAKTLTLQASYMTSRFSLVFYVFSNL